MFVFGSYPDSLHSAFQNSST